MTNVYVPASVDGRYDSCIYTQLPLMPDAWKSRTVPLTTLVEMSKRENYLRIEDASYRTLFFLVHRDAHGDVAQFEDTFVPLFRSVVGIEPDADPSMREEPLFSSASVIILLQYQVLKEFGYDPMANATALYELRTAAMMHPDVAELQSSVQFKYNRQGNPHDVVEGRVGPDVHLFHPQTLVPCTFHELLKALTLDEVKKHQMGTLLSFAHFPTVVLTGSYT